MISIYEILEKMYKCSCWKQRYNWITIDKYIDLSYYAYEHFDAASGIGEAARGKDLSCCRRGLLFLFHLF